MKSWINQTLNSDSDAWYFICFITSNFFKQRPFSEFFSLKLNENDKMVEREGIGIVGRREGLKSNVSGFTKDFLLWK